MGIPTSGKMLFILKYTNSTMTKIKQEAPREHKPPPRLFWGVWNSLAKAHGDPNSSIWMLDSCIDGLVQERRNSSTLAMGLRVSWINPSVLCRNCHDFFKIRSQFFPRCCTKANKETNYNEHITFAVGGGMRGEICMVTSPPDVLGSMPGVGTTRCYELWQI